MKPFPVSVLPGFLTDAECDALIAAARPRMRRSSLHSRETGADYVADNRTSTGCFIHAGELALLADMDARIKETFGMEATHGESVQILRYEPGQQYLPHFDWFDPKDPGSTSTLKRGGQRVATVLMYLATPDAGGETFFPQVGITVAAKRGLAAFFPYHIEPLMPLSQHGGNPVVAGEKWVATKWYRQSTFR